MQICLLADGRPSPKQAKEKRTVVQVKVQIHSLKRTRGRELKQPVGMYA